MSKPLEYQGPFRIESLTRLNNSVNGNPTWRVELQATTAEIHLTSRTQTDSSIAYSINNGEYRDSDVMVSFSRAGRIVDIKPVEENK